MSENQNIDTLIVCIDSSNASEVTLRFACHKAKKNNFALQILSVMEASHKNLLFGSKAIEDEKRNDMEESIKKLVDKICAEAGIIPSISIREGDIVREITHEIKSNPNCAMLILGKSDNALSDNTVLPRIAKRIGNKIHIPVLIVPENLDENYLKRIV
jgi:nucleotide-binding universal stress UspA family protein